MIKNTLQKIDISIVFLLYNGLGDHFEETLTMVRNQKTDCCVEMIAIDSGSTDGTVDFVSRQRDVILHKIPNNEFGHGKTRQMGTELAHGTYVIFLTQDATPTNESWLDHLVKKIEEGDGHIVAACSRILPREDAMAIRKYGIMSEWTANAEDFVVSGKEIKDYKMHDVSTIYKKDFLLKYHFDDVSFGEDVLIAKKILQSGYAFAFSADSVVRHSHAYDVRSIFKRNIIDGRFNRIYLQKDTISSILNLLGATCKLVLRDLKLLSKDQHVTFWEKIVNILYSPIIHFVEAFAQYKGNKL